MSKGLLKLKIIRHIHDMECGKDERIDKDFDVIETELKEHEQNKTLEQELGIDLVTLFKALKNGACFKRYDKNGNVEIKRVPLENISLRKSGEEWVFDIKLKNFSTGYIIRGNYGKTWALTREELEK